MGFITAFLLNAAVGLLRRLPVHVGVYMSVLDEKGQESTINFKFPAASDLAVVQSWIQVMAQRVDAVILGQVVDSGLSLSVDISGLGLKTAPMTGSDVQEKALISMGTDAGTLTTATIPTFDETYFDSSGIADLANADILAMVNHIVDGQTNGLTNASPSNAYGNDVTEVAAVSETFSR